MAVRALVFFGVFVAVAFGLRSFIQLRRTGSFGFRGIRGAMWSADWVGGVGMVLAYTAGLAAPVLELIRVMAPVRALAAPWVAWVGQGLFAAGLIATFVAQMAMGDSWRIGVAREEVTTLVTGGPFSAVRNPIFSAMMVTSLGLALMVPNVVALAGWVLLVASLELHVRVVEEPQLRAVHGEAYARYAARVGRFVPGVGRLRAD